MDRRLFEAALRGDVQNLHLLLEENPLILHTSAIALAGNPLHVASAYGHIDFAKEIIRLKPDLAKEVNQDGLSPVHMASANGQVEIVRELIKFHLKLCRLQGQEKKTPLHFAAIKGRINVVAELLSACEECIEDLTVQRETTLHLAIKNNQFEAIRVMVDWIRQVKKEHILNMKDEQGNTILHLATWKKQREVIELLLGQGANDSGGLEVNAINQSGLTALDVLVTFPSEAGDREIEEIFRSAGALRKRDLTISPNLSPDLNNETSVNRPAAAQTNQLRSNDLVGYFKFKKGRDSPGETRSVLLVVAALVATATFQFAVNPPGGLWKDNSTSNKAYKAGESILGSVNKVGYALFMFFNTMGFKLSIHMINILTTKFPLQFELQLCFLAVNFTYDTAAINLAPNGIRLFVILTVSIMPSLSWAAYMARKYRKRLRKQTSNP